jgi:hypothetical protein
MPESIPDRSWQLYKEKVKKMPGKRLKWIIYSMWIASEGQTSTQVSHSTHISLSTHAFSSSIDIADAGHSLTQVSHPVHFSLFTTATKFFTPQQ